MSDNLVRTEWYGTVAVEYRLPDGEIIQTAAANQLSWYHPITIEIKTYGDLQQ